MNTRTIKQKLKSTKFWLAVSQVVGGMLMMFGFSDNTVGLVTGAIVSLSGAVVYIITEGKIDAASAGAKISTAVSDTQKAVTAVAGEIK